MKYMIIILTLFPLITNAYFCSAFCSPNQCSGITSSDCQACDDPFYLDGSSCSYDTDKYDLIEEADMSLTFSSTTTCSSYNFYGYFDYFSNERIRTDNSITVPHYGFRFIIWLMFKDDFTISTSQFQIYQRQLNDIRYFYPDSVVTDENLGCGSSSDSEKYVKIDQFYYHSVSETLRFDLDCNVNAGDFGIKQIMVLVHKCHQYCSACSDGSNEQCSTCETGYKQSGTVCDVSCIDGYGDDGTDICIQCSNYCLKCENIASNCSSCITNGTYEAFLYSSSCLTSCPSGYAAVEATHVCQACSNSDCLECDPSDLSICYDCNSLYWFDFDCISSCPDNYYEDGSNCSLCDSSCFLCDGNPSPCSQCSSSYYFLSNQCYDVCPTNYFEHYSTMTCRDCSVYCVTATLTISLVTEDELQINVTFSQNIDFSTLPYKTYQQITIIDDSLTLDKFDISYDLIDEQSYIITIIPKPGVMMIMDASQFRVNIKNTTVDYYSKNGNKFSQSIYALEDSVEWTYFKHPGLDDSQQQIVDLFKNVNNQINEFFGQQYVQEIKKSGVLMFFMPGAQIASSVVLHDGQPAQNSYEGIRFWANFVFFQVPEWEQDGSEIKYIMSEKISSILGNSRLLYVADNKPDLWRFLRTGNSTYFMFDTYLQLGLLLFCWIMIFALQVFKKRFPRLIGFGYTFLHRVHEISLFYVWIGIILEWMNFDANEDYRVASLCMSIVATLYFMIYQVYVFYRIIPYAFVEPSSKKYAEYIQKYSFFLRDIRFQEYDNLKPWTIRHLRRPYNYKVFSFYRIILMMAAVPLFYGFSHAAITCLIVIQGLQILRFIFTWPFSSFWRNLYQLTLECILISFFAVYLVDYIVVTELYDDPNSVTSSDLSYYYSIGWAAAILIFIYNIGFIIYFIIDLIIGCKYTNRERMEASRRSYYQTLLDEYENYQAMSNKQTDISERRSSYISMLNTIQEIPMPDAFKTKRKVVETFVRKGNLQERDYEGLQTIYVKIEEFVIKQVPNCTSFEISYNCVPGIFMHINIDIQRKNNIFIPQRKTKEIKLFPVFNKFYFKETKDLYRKYSSISTESMILRTFAKVNQNKYQPGMEIPIKRCEVIQYVEVRSYNGNKRTQKLDKLLEGFPIPWKILEQL